jgi:hypothetical protein
MNTTINLSNSGMKTVFIRYIKYAGAFVKPKDMTRYSYNPHLVEKCGFRYILWPDLDLMVTRSQIYLGEHSGFV